MKKVISLLLVAVMMIAVVGCGSSSSDTKETEAVKETEAAEEPEEKASTDDTYTIGITIQSLENSYWAGVFGEVETLLKEKGWNYTILACDDNSAKQIQQIENFISNEVDMIMVHPSDPNALEDYLKQAQDAGIKVMVWDDIMENTDVNWVLDNAELGYAIGESAANFINEHFSPENPVQVAIINYPQTPILLDRENGILKALNEIAGDSMEVVAQQPGLDAQTALTSMETILQSNPDVKVVCTIGAGGDIGANQAFMTKYEGDIPDDVGIFSADATEQQLQAIVDGEATRVTVGFEGSNLRTAQAVVDMYEKVLTGYEFEDQNVYRPLLPIDKDTAAEYLAEF